MTCHEEHKACSTIIHKHYVRGIWLRSHIIIWESPSLSLWYLWQYYIYPAMFHKMGLLWQTMWCILFILETTLCNVSLKCDQKKEMMRTYLCYDSADRCFYYKTTKPGKTETHKLLHYLEWYKYIELWFNTWSKNH